MLQKGANISKNLTGFLKEEIEKMKIDSLKKKTILFIFILTVLCIAGSAFMASQVVEKQTTDKYKADKDVSIEVLSYSLAPMLDLYDYKQVEQLITSSLGYEKIASVAVFDGSGTLIKSAAEQNVSAKDLDMEKREITTSLEGIIGSIEIGFSKAYINSRIRTMTATLIFGLMGIFIFIGLGLYEFMSRSIIKPLETFTKTVKEMNSENLSASVKIFRKDEIGTLAASFNQMAGNLEKSHKALRESEERYRAIFQGATEGILIADIETKKFKYANPAISEILGYTEEEFKRMSVSDIHPKEALGYVISEFEAQARGEKQLSPTILCLRKDGETIYVDICTAKILIDGVYCNVGFFTNITERKRLEEQLRHAQKMEAIGTLAGGIAHDFNNILSAIIGFSELALRETPQKTKLHENIQEILKAGHRARDLVKQILTFSRQAEEERKPVQVHLIVNEVLKLLRSSLPSTIQIHQQVEIGTDTVLADPTQIHQILLNLCTNASHAMMEEGGILKVNLGKVELDPDFTAQYPDMNPESYLKLSVSDTGHGMSPDVLNRIFEPYFTTKEKGEGTGLGMAVVHGIVKSHGGSIKVDSEPGKGSTFHVYLPIIHEMEKLEKETEKPLPTGNERILFIDDEHALTDLGKQMLNKLGYEVVTRTSSVGALELFRTKPDQFDLVITDMTMPNMTGDRLAIELMKIRPDIAIILCTGYSAKISKEKAKEIGISAFAMKPLVMQDLAIIVRKVLDET